MTENDMIAPNEEETKKNTQIPSDLVDRYDPMCGSCHHSNSSVRSSVGCSRRLVGKSANSRCTQSRFLIRLSSFFIPEPGFCNLRLRSSLDS